MNKFILSSLLAFVLASNVNALTQSSGGDSSFSAAKVKDKSDNSQVVKGRKNSNSNETKQ